MKLNYLLVFGIVAARNLSPKFQYEKEICVLKPSPLQVVYPRRETCLLNSSVEDSLNNTTNHHTSTSSFSQPYQYDYHPRTSLAPCSYSNKSEFELCVFADSEFVSNRGISIVTTARRAEFLLNVTSMKSSEDAHDAIIDGVEDTRLSLAKYRMAPIPGKGIGVLSKQKFSPGDLIMAQTPSLLIDARIDLLPDDQRLFLLSQSIGLLPPAHRARVLDLSTHEPNITDHAHRVSKIIKTNTFFIQSPAIDPEPRHHYNALFYGISRLNHDCRPNSGYHFDFKTMTQYVYALRNISPGEEITVSYIDPVATRAVRREMLLRTWGFACSCSMCQQSDSGWRASDDRIALIDIFSKDLESRGTPHMAELFVSLFEQEKLFIVLYEAYASAAIEWNRVGDRWLALKYAYLAIENGLYSGGVTNPVVVEMQALAEDPEKHWSWMLL